jgi:hypothetical protein
MPRFFAGHFFWFTLYSLADWVELMRNANSLDWRGFWWVWGLTRVFAGEFAETKFVFGEAEK